MKGCLKFFAIAFLLLCALSFGRYYFLLTPEQREAEVKAWKEKAKAEDKPTAASAPRSGVIPGLAPVDVYLNLESKGFTTKKNFGKEQSDFVCSLEEGGAQYNATIYMPAPGVQDVSVVTAMLLNVGQPEAMTDTQARGFFGYISTLTYNNAAPDEARAWVEANLGKNAETSIRGVRFQLFANSPRGRVLRMSAK